MSCRKISSRTCLVRREPSKYGTVMYTLHLGCIVKEMDRRTADDGMIWINLSCGWICSRDANGSLCYLDCDHVEAEKFWASELQNRRRISAAIGQMLTKSYSLKILRRIAAAVVEQSKEYTILEKPFTNIPEICFEDLLIALSSSSTLKANEVLEYLKVAASQQSDPHYSLLDMATYIHEMLTLRPSLWVTRNLGVLETADLKSKNDQFVMAAARGDLQLVKSFIADGQALTSVHSDLQYTALHAASDFGSLSIVEYLIQCGVSINVRDARLGRTALHFAAQSGRIEISQKLLENGADRAALDFRNMLPFEVAKEHGQFEARELLKHLPPEIQNCQVIDCTAYSISLRWLAPVIHANVHARINEFIVLHEYVDEIPQRIIKYRTKECIITVSNLQPSTGHGFSFYSQSVAGLSKPSPKVIFFTLPAMPDAPPKVEMLKVTQNGLVLAWHPPATDNGSKLDMYQLEMTSEPPSTIDESESISLSESMDSFEPTTTTISTNTNTSAIQLNDISNVTSSAATAASTTFTTRRSHTPFKQSSNNNSNNNNNNSNNNNRQDSNDSHTILFKEKWHRIIKHRNVHLREKYLMGLESLRDYYFRVRARNEFGWSEWSVWAGPFTPQEGVKVRSAGDGLIGLSWVPPELTSGRKVMAYEVQACQPSGPKMSTINVFHKQHIVNSNNNKDESISNNEFSNAAATKSFNFYTLFNDLTEPQTVVSGLKPGMKYQFRVRPNIDGIWGEWNVMGATSDVVPVPAATPDAPTDVKEKLEITYDNEGLITESRGTATHESVTVTWTNGIPNGSPVLEFQIQKAKVYVYRNMTHEGKRLSPNSFIAHKLTPGGSYVFRVRQRNSIGWSAYSAPSAVVKILLVAPPSAPRVISVCAYYAVIEWESQNDSFGFSTLEHEVNTAVVIVGQGQGQGVEEDGDGHGHGDDNGDGGDGVVLDAAMFSWSSAITRRAEEDSHGNYADQFNCKRVLVDKLSPWTVYVTRVRVRTVAGWSVWSDASEAFRTLSPP
eukprot:gene7584-15544_t